MVRMGCRHRSESLLAHRLVGIGARSRRMTTLERVAFAVAAVTLAALGWVLDPAAVGKMGLGVGWGVALVLSQESVAHLLNAFGWRLAFTAGQARAVPLGEFAKLRMPGASVYYSSPSAPTSARFTLTA